VIGDGTANAAKASAATATPTAVRQGGLTRRGFLQAGGAAAVAAVIPAEAAARPDVQRAKGRHGEREAELIPSICEMCFWKCGIRGKVIDGKLVRIEGNPDHPLSRGRLCSRGNAGVGLLYDPDRLAYPMERVGPRGQGRFRRISWEEAFARIGSEFKRILERHGPDALAFFGHGTSAKYPRSMMEALGSHSLSSASFFQCRGPREAAYTLTFGMTPGSPERVDMAESKLIVLTGTHIGENVHVSQAGDLADGLARGAKLAVIDPRYSVVASKADWWLPIRPGTDTALFLTWIRHLIANDLYDREYVEKYATGFDRLAEHVRPFDPAWARGHTGLSADVIEEIGDEMGRARPAVALHPGRLTTWYGNDTQRARAMAILTALLGAWGRPGGLFYPSPVALGACPCDPKDDPRKPVCLDDQYHFRDEGIPVHCIVDNTLADPAAVRGWLVWGQNLLQSAPFPQRTAAAMERVEFLAVVDVLPTEVTQFADILLPESTYLERYDEVFAERNAKVPFLALRQPVVPPVHDTRDGFAITKGILEALGRTDCLPCGSIEAFVAMQLEEAEVDFADLRRRGIVELPGFPYRDEPRFFTKSEKIELYSEALAEKGLPPLPAYAPPEAVPAGMLRLIAGRTPYHSFARSMNNALLLAHASESPVFLNDEQGAAMGLSDGDAVALENQDGVRVGPVTARLTPGLRPGLAYVWHGFGGRSTKMRRAFGRGISENRLTTRFAVDPETGSTGIRVNFVRVVKDDRPLDAPEIDVGIVAVRRDRKAASYVPIPAAAPAAPAAGPSGAPPADGPPKGGC
jgi:thiosulfate reductase/polysulfide reductase chain A